MQRFALLALMLCTATATTSKTSKPHVIFALIDDWGSYDAAWREKELGRPPQLRTPTLDALSVQGVKLDSYYVQHICTPTRQALMSGRYQIHTGLQHGIIQNSQKRCERRARPPVSLALLCASRMLTLLVLLQLPAPRVQHHRRRVQERRLRHLDGRQGALHNAALLHCCCCAAAAAAADPEFVSVAPGPVQGGVPALGARLRHLLRLPHRQVKHIHIRGSLL